MTSSVISVPVIRITYSDTVVCILLLTVLVFWLFDIQPTFFDEDFFTGRQIFMGPAFVSEEGDTEVDKCSELVLQGFINLLPEVIPNTGS
jgi:hypothetical protein